MISLGLEPDAVERAVEAAFTRLDADGDGLITLAEFARAAVPLTEPTLRAAFDLFDVDHSGIIKEEEFNLMLERLGMAPAAGEHSSAAEQVAEIFRVADTDSDGGISFGEFVAMLPAVAKHSTRRGGTRRTVSRS